MGFIIEQKIKRYNFEFENFASDKITKAILNHQLYGSSEEEAGHLAERLHEVFMITRK
jgi:flavorubredoxin